VSSSTGIDYDDDGRALAVTDWDGDGDLDLWIRNRSGPQLRFLRNDGANDGHYVQFLLTGKTCNRDAIGAKVEVHAAGRRLIRALLAGDGYLAQSSKWLHFGLGETDRIDQVVIRWPNGVTQKLAGPPVDGRYKIVEGKEKFVNVAKRRVTIDCAPASIADPPPLTRLLLTEPLPLPPTLTQLSRKSGDRVLVINLWAHWCAGCRDELRQFAASASRLSSLGIDIVAVNLDESADQPAAREFFESQVGAIDGDLQLRFAEASLTETIQSVLHHVRHNPRSTPLPASLLVDSRGQLQMIYYGAVHPEQLIVDAQAFCATQVPSHARMLSQGRWYARHRRNLPTLAMDLRSRGCVQDAQFYEEMVGQLP